MSMGRPIPEMRLFQTLTLKLQGQGNGCGQRARSYSWPSIHLTRFLFMSHQSDQQFLMVHTEIQEWNSMTFQWPFHDLFWTFSSSNDDSVLGKGGPIQYAYFKCIFMEFDNLPKVLLGLFMKQWIWRDTWNNFITVSSFLFSVWCSLSVLPYIIKWVYVTGMGSVLLTCINAYVLKPLVFLWYVFLQ